MLLDYGFFLDDVDVVEGEGFEFVENVNVMEKELLKKVVIELFEVIKEIVGYFVQIFKMEWIDKDQRDLLVSNSIYYGVSLVVLWVGLDVNIV